MCKQITMRWLFCNKVEMCWWKSGRCKNISEKSKHTHARHRDVRQNEETKKENGSSKDNLIILHGPSLGIETFLCNDDDGHTKNIVVWFQNLLWVYGMAWMRVRFPGLKFCYSPPLHLGDHIIVLYYLFLLAISHNSEKQKCAGTIGLYL